MITDAGAVRSSPHPFMLMVSSGLLLDRVTVTMMQQN